jgi:hypothetical protein
MALNEGSKKIEVWSWALYLHVRIIVLLYYTTFFERSYR